MRERLREIFDAFVIVVALQAVMVLVGLLFTAGKGTYNKPDYDLMVEHSELDSGTVMEGDLVEGATE